MVVRLLRGIDVRQVGSGNAGATNVLRVAGAGPAAAVLTLDVAKGAVPMWLALEMAAQPLIIAGVAFAAVLGHLFPLYIGFRGGKGVATALGAFASLAFWPTLAAVAVTLALISWKRYVSLGSIVGVALVPLLMLWWKAALWQAALGAGVAVLVVVRHAGNIRRLRAGTERRLGEQVEALR